MRFWDASAIVPLFAEELGSKSCRQLLYADPRIIVWAFTRTEVLSALWRAHHSGSLERGDVADAARKLDKLARRWNEVDALLPVREQAERLLRIHRLRAADALQLAAALVAFDHRPRGRELVCSDDRLSLAADAEGFDVIQPAPSR